MTWSSILGQKWRRVTRREIWARVAQLLKWLARGCKNHVRFPTKAWLFISATASRPALSPVQWVLEDPSSGLRGPECEPRHSALFTAEANNAWSQIRLHVVSQTSTFALLVEKLWALLTSIVRISLFDFWSVLVPTQPHT